MAGKLFNLKELPTHAKLVNRTNNTAGQPVQFRDLVRWIRVVKFGGYCYRYSLHDEEDSKTVNILQSGMQEMLMFDVRTAVGQCHGKIKKAKLDDVKKQIPFIPEVY
jgi:hypothetical protein